MKGSLYLILLFSTQLLYAQRYNSKTGTIEFFSEEVLEDITAINKKVKSVFDSESGQIVFSLPIAGFKFKKSLMQEHFNEKYLESEKYPRATFVGTVSGFEVNKKNPDVLAEGVLEIHGVKKNIKVNGSLNYDNGVLRIHSVFTLKLVDFDIEIPSLMFHKIAKEIEVTLNIEYNPYEK